MVSRLNFKYPVIFVESVEESKRGLEVHQYQICFLYPLKSDSVSIGTGSEASLRKRIVWYLFPLC